MAGKMGKCQHNEHITTAILWGIIYVHVCTCIKEVHACVFEVRGQPWV